MMKKSKQNHDLGSTPQSPAIGSQATALGIRGFNTDWLLKCFSNWTRSSVQTGAWKFRPDDFDGFVRWFLNVPV